MRTILTLAAVALSSTALAADPQAPMTSAAPDAASHEHILVKPNDVKWGEPPPGLPRGSKAAVIEGNPTVAGAPFTMRAKLPNGYTVPPHFHPADEHVTVLSGTLMMGMGDTLDAKIATALPAGGFAVMPKGAHHFAIAKGETIIQIHGTGPFGITYINPSDDPRTKERVQ